MNRTVPPRLLFGTTLLAALAGFALATWRSQPPHYTAQAESLLYQTQVSQVIFTGPLRTVVQNPDGSMTEKIIVHEKEQTAPGQSAFLPSQSDSSPTSSSARMAPPPTPRPSTVVKPPPLPTRPPQAIPAATYRKLKTSTAEWLKKWGVPMSALAPPNELREGPAPLCLTFQVTTETVPGAVGIKLALDVKRHVLGNRVAHEGEQVIVANYHTGTFWVTPGELPTGLEDMTYRLVKDFSDDWVAAQKALENEADSKP